MHILMQAATQHYVQFLVAAANCEKRNACFERSFDKLQRCFITMRIMQGTLPAGFSIVVMWLDV